VHIPNGCYGIAEAGKGFDNKFVGKLPLIDDADFLWIVS